MTRKLTNANYELSEYSQLEYHHGGGNSEHIFVIRKADVSVGLDLSEAHNLMQSIRHIIESVRDSEDTTT